MATNGSGTYMGPVPVFTADNGLELRYGETPAIGTGYSMRGLPVGSRTPGIRTMMDVDGTKTSFDPMGKIVDQSGPFSMEQSSPSRIAGGSSFGSSSFGSSSFGASPFYSSSMPFDPRVYGGNGFDTASAGASTKSDMAATAQMSQLLNGFEMAAKKAADTGDLGSAGMYSSQASQASDLYQDQIANGMSPGSAWESVRAVSTAFGGDFSRAKDNLDVLQRMANRRGISLTEMGAQAAKIRDIFGPMIVNKSTVDVVGHTADSVSQLLQTFDDYETRNNGRHLSVDGLTRIKNNVLVLKNQLAGDSNSFQFSDTDWIQASIYQSGDHTTYGNQKPIILQYDDIRKRDEARIGLNNTRMVPVTGENGKTIQVPVEQGPVMRDWMKSFVQSVRAAQLSSPTRDLNTLTDDEKTEAVNNMVSKVMNTMAFSLNDPNWEEKQNQIHNGLTQICDKLADSLVHSDGRPLDFISEYEKLLAEMRRKNQNASSSTQTASTSATDTTAMNSSVAVPDTNSSVATPDAQANSSPENWGPRAPKPWLKNTSYDPLDLRTHQYLDPSVDDEIKSRLAQGETNSWKDADFFSAINDVYQGKSDTSRTWLFDQKAAALKSPGSLGSLGEFGARVLGEQAAKTHSDMPVLRKSRYIEKYNPEENAKNAMSSCVNLLRIVKPFVDIGLVKADEITGLLKPVTDMCSETGLIMPADPKSVLSDSYKTYEAPILRVNPGYRPVNNTDFDYPSVKGVAQFRSRVRQAAVFAEQMGKLSGRLHSLDPAYLYAANNGHLGRLLKGVDALRDYASACHDLLQLVFEKYNETTHDYDPNKHYLTPADYKDLIQNATETEIRNLDDGSVKPGLIPLKNKRDEILHGLVLGEDEPVTIARQMQKMTPKDKQEK